MATVIGLGGKRKIDNLAGRGPPRATAKLGKILSLGVIPRLLMVHSRPPAAPENELVRGAVGRADIARIAPIAVHEAAHVLLEEIEAIMRRGVTAEEIFVDLLAPVARWVGEEWEEDRLDFVQVSMALWRLQEVLRQVAANTSRSMEEDSSRSALFTTMPGDQHSFGTAMVHECFTLAGWDAEMIVESTIQQVVDTLANRRFDLFGLTISCDCQNERLTSFIRSIRSVSVNPNLCIMLGGRVPADQPHLVALAGADGTAPTAPAAIKMAERLVGMMRMAATA